MTKLSVIVPVYNAEHTLSRCVDSILNQELSDLEVILIDDGSTDSSLNICKEYAERDSRVTVFHKENAGLVSARKSGVAIASGEYVGFVDSDDYIDSDMYFSLMNEAEAKGADIVIGGIVLDYPDRSTKSYNRLPAGYYNRADIEGKIIPEMLMPSGFFKFGIIPGVVVKVFKKGLIKESLEHVYDSITIGEDVAITSFSVMRAGSISIIESAAYHYIQTEASMIRGYNPKRFEQICRMYECVSQIEEPAYKKQLGAYFSCLLYSVLADCVHNKEFTKKEAKEKMKALIEDEVSINALKSADISQWTLQDRIKVLLMKNKMVSILYTILAR